MEEELAKEPVPSFDEINSTGQKIKSYSEKILNISKMHYNYYQKILQKQSLLKDILDLDKEIEILQIDMSKKQQQLVELDRRLTLMSETLAEKQKHYELFLKNKPSSLDKFLGCLLSSAKSKIEQWENKNMELLHEMEIHTKEKEALLKNKEVLQDSINSIFKEMKELSETKQSLQEQLKNLELDLNNSKSFLKDAVFDEEDFVKFYFTSEEQLPEEEKEKFYLYSPYKEEKIDKLRMLIFIESLRLHKLLILKYKELFIEKLKLFAYYLSNPVRFVGKEEQVKELFAVFFFMIPVTSTTFASFNKMFQVMPKSSIGYLFIDEAGQAVPYYAFMPIYKANRTVVVGDPDQIEPVVVLSEKLDNILCQIYQVGEDYQVTKNSVQTFADRASLQSAVYKYKRVGIPLNVHRRCNDPMFRIANKIAYNDRMIKANKKDKFTLLLPETFPKSAWIQVKREDSRIEDGVVINEVNVLRKLLSIFDSFLQSQKEDIEKFVKDKNLFIITPFVSVKNYLLKELQKGCALEKALANNGEAKYIGTIHTFQGKEAKAVVIILGGRTENSMAWVAEKPNMLNVALTRAKESVFVIGDKDKWKKLSYFSYAVTELPVLDEKQFFSAETHTVSSLSHQ